MNKYTVDWSDVHSEYLQNYLKQTQKHPYSEGYMQV